jgi:hypothetical protein
MGNSSSKKGAPDASAKVGGGGGAPAGLPPISVEGRRDGAGEERKEGGSASPPSSPLAVPLPTPPFVVALLGGFEGAPMPKQFGLVLDVEALRLHSLEDNVSPLRRGAAPGRERDVGYVAPLDVPSHSPLRPRPVRRSRRPCCGSTPTTRSSAGALMRARSSGAPSRTARSQRPR